MKHKVVAGVRTKDEEWIIEKTLAALQNFCHKVVVYDDNSIDKTKEMCNSFDVVDWHEGPPRNPLIWKAGEQFSDLLSMFALMSQNIFCFSTRMRYQHPILLIFLKK